MIRKVYHAAISIPGKSEPRFAPITCSSGTKVNGRPFTRHPARQTLRHFDAREVDRPALRIANLDRERQREIRDVRERVAGIDGERREHRKDLRLEVLVDLAPFTRCEIADGDQSNAVRCQLIEQLDQTLALQCRESRDLGIDRVERRLRREPVRGFDGHSRGYLPPQSGNANHVELVEVRAEDRQELDSLQQRNTRRRALR